VNKYYVRTAETNICPVEQAYPLAENIELVGMQELVKILAAA